MTATRSHMNGVSAGIILTKWPTKPPMIAASTNPHYGDANHSPNTVLMVARPPAVRYTNTSHATHATNVTITNRWVFRFGVS